MSFQLMWISWFKPPGIFSVHTGKKKNSGDINRILQLAELHTNRIPWLVKLQFREDSSTIISVWTSSGPLMKYIYGHNIRYEFPYIRNKNMKLTSPPWLCNSMCAFTYSKLRLSGYSSNAASTSCRASAYCFWAERRSISRWRDGTCSARRLSAIFTWLMASPTWHPYANCRAR